MLRESMQGVWSRRTSWAAISACGFLAATCHREPVPREPAPPEPAPATAAPVPTVSVVPVTDASPPVSDAGGADAALADAQAFGPAPATTPGKILCGDRQCNLALEVCCENEVRGVAQCVPKPAKDQYACEKLDDAVYERHCDEKADCPGSQTCCMTWGCSGGCPPVAVCSDFPCLHGPVEQCLPGGACSSGFRCNAGDGNRPGYCVFEKAGVACGKQRCTGDKAVCCWNSKKRTGECARDCGEEPDEDRWALHCTTSDDCGGYPCANAMVTPLQFTTCLGAYDVPDRSSVVFCRNLADCPTMNMFGKPKACVADRRFPGNAKTCRFASP